MRTVVEIEWDEPQEEHWLCPDNIAIALHAYCPNTKFKVTKATPFSVGIDLARPCADKTIYYCNGCGTASLDYWPKCDCVAILKEAKQS